MSAAWRRQWLRQWQRQVQHNRNAVGLGQPASSTIITSSARPPCPSMAMMLSPHQRRCCSSGAAAAAASGGRDGDHNGGGGSGKVAAGGGRGNDYSDGGGKGKGASSPPRPQASSSWSYQRRRSDRLDNNDRGGRIVVNAARTSTARLDNNNERRRDVTNTIDAAATITTTAVQRQRPSTMQRLESLQSKFDTGNLSALERFMDNGNDNNNSYDGATNANRQPPNANDGKSSWSSQNNGNNNSTGQWQNNRGSASSKQAGKASNLRPRSWKKNGHLIPEQYRNSNGSGNGNANGNSNGNDNKDATTSSAAARTNNNNNNNKPASNNSNRRKNNSKNSARYNGRRNNGGSNSNSKSKDISISISQCRTIPDILRAAHGHLDAGLLPPDATTLFWRKMSSLPPSQKNGTSEKPPHQSSLDDDDDTTMAHRLNALHRHTLDGLADDSYGPDDVGNLAQACATIVRNVGAGPDRGKKLPPRALDLRRTFVECDDDDDDDALLLWERIGRRTVALGDACPPKRLVSVAWAYATIYRPMQRGGGGGSGRQGGRKRALDVAPFFDMLRDTFNKRRGEFTSKHMGNLAWACMTCRESNAGLFEDFSEEFVARRKKEAAECSSSDDDGDTETVAVERDLDPVVLGQWANAYAKAKHEDEELFRSIAAAAVPMMLDEKFDSRNCANISYACALAGTVPTLDDGSTFFDKIAGAAVPIASEFRPLRIANTLWAYAKMDHASPDLFDALVAAALPQLGDFSAQQFANLAWAVSKFPSESHDATFDRLAEEVARRGLDQFTSQGLAMLAHSFATVGHTRSAAFWDSIDDAAINRLSELGPIECSQIAWSMATIERPSEELFKGIESIVMSKLHYIKPQGFSNISWAFAMLGHDSPDFFEVIATESVLKLQEFSPQDKVMLALAYSKTSNPPQELFDEIASSSISDLSKFTALNLFNLVMSYTKVGYQSDAWMEAIANEIVSRPSKFPRRLIVGVAYAYASAGIRHSALFRVLAESCVDHCDELTTKEVASLAWSFASTGQFDRQLLGALADSSDGRWQDFDATSLARMSWAYATAQDDRASLFEGIINAAIERKDEFAPQGLSMILWACADTAHLDQRLPESLAPSAALVLREMSGQSLVNLAWAYSVANVNDGLLFGANSHFIDTVAEKFDEFDEQGLSQLHQWNLWRKEMDEDTCLPEHLEKRCYDSFASNSFQISAMQKDVISELISMGIHLEEEALTPSGYRLDALIDVNGEKIGVEVDGPYHFLGRKPTGKTILKRRQVLKVDGIPIVSIPYWELEGLGSSEDMQTYLRAKLNIGV